MSVLCVLAHAPGMLPDARARRLRNISGLRPEQLRSCLARRRVASVGLKRNKWRVAHARRGRIFMDKRAILLGAALAHERERRARAGQDSSSCACRTGCRRRIRCRRRWRTGALDREGLERHHQVQGLSRRSSSARRSTTTTWRATASPTSPTSARATSPAASRSSTPATCRS